MADYLLIYEGSDPDWAKRSPEEIQAVMEQWGAWFKELEASGNLRNGGSALGPGGALLSNDGDQIRTDRALPEVKELIGGFSIITADSLEEAAEIAKGTPFLTNNPKGSVLVRPIMEM